MNLHNSLDKGQFTTIDKINWYMLILAVSQILQQEYVNAF
jgi:hypothetical protein